MDLWHIIIIKYPIEAQEKSEDGTGQYNSPADYVDIAFIYEETTILSFEWALLGQEKLKKMTM